MSKNLSLLDNELTNASLPIILLAKNKFNNIYKISSDNSL